MERDLLLDYRNDHGDTVLNIAALNGHIQVVEYLALEVGADVNVEGFSKRTPLLQACDNGGQLPIVEFFWKNGADIDREDGEQGCKAIHLAAAFGNVNLVSFLLNKRPDWLEVKSSKAGRTPLLHAAEAGNLTNCQYLIEEKSANSRATDDCNGDSALHLACFVGHINVVTYFANNYARLFDLKDKHGSTPYALAVKQKNDIVVRFLQSRNIRK